MPTEYAIRLEDGVSNMPITSKGQNSMLTEWNNTELINGENSRRNEQSVFDRNRNICKERVELTDQEWR